MNISTKLPKEISDRLGKMFPNGAGLHEPRFEGREWEYIKECLDTGWVSSVGKFVDRFEKDLADFTGVKRAVVVANGTAALQVCMRLVGVERGDEVLMPALTFIASANAVAYQGAIPHFIDCDERSLGVDPAKLGAYLKEIADRRADGTYNRNTGRRIKALMVMHTFGHPVDLDPIIQIAEHYRIELVEDAAEALGSRYKGHHVGRFGHANALSFNGNKIMTTGGGGAILTDDEELGKHAKHLTTQAKIAHPWEYVHDEIGYNYRLPNINSALGCAQLESLPSFLERKKHLTAQYVEMFQGLEGVKFFREPEYAQSNQWLNAIVLDQPDLALRDLILKACHGRKIYCRPIWQLMSRLPMFKDCPKMDLSVAESLEARVINIPSSVPMKQA